jgi:transposase
VSFGNGLCATEEISDITDMSREQLVTEDAISRQPPEAQAIIRLLLARIDQQDRRIAELDARVKELESRLIKTPQNSSLPPSSQHPHAKPAPPRQPSGKKRGGQPGHPKYERALVPTEECTEVVTLVPSACRRCGDRLAGNDAEPWRHQVWEVPEIHPLVTEYQLHRLLCPACGITTCAELPAGVPTGQAGPRLVALVALLMGCFRQSKRRVALFLEQVLGQPCSPGWVVKLQNQATASLRAPYQEVVSQLPIQDALAIDESPTKEGRAKAWLWTCVAPGAPGFTVFALRTTRAATVLEELLTERFDGAVMCDRAKMYWQQGRLQWCWAHLKRDFQALVDHPDHQVKRLGRELMPLTRELFRLWARSRDGTITRTGLKRLMHPVRQKVEALLLRGVYSGNPRLVGMCEELYDHREWLWTFLDVVGVEPTNNASERSLRHAVIWRKLSFGTQSARGSRFVETILTVVETCRQQSRSVFAFVAESVQAQLDHRPAPSLITGL